MRGEDTSTAQASGLGFEALYHRDLLHPVNPRGDTGLLTLWSPFPSVARKLGEIAPAVLDPDSSRVAVVSNLYGDGMLAMFCNLLFNPQVRHLVAIGEDLGLPTCEEIELFLQHGLEDAVMLGTPVRRIPGTERIFPAIAGFDDARLRRRLSFRCFGKLSAPGLGEELTAHLDGLPAESSAATPQRLRVEIPEPAPEDFSFQPSQHIGHRVNRARPLECWQELVVRAIRFGRPVSLRKGTRFELLNAEVVITDPREEPPEQLAQLGFDPDRLASYQEQILDPALPEEISYTYGNRLRGYFRQAGGSTDALAAAVDKLRTDPESRRAYISLWDTPSDLPDPSGAKPCLTTLFFRRSEGRLTLTATYRLHNLLWAWLENVYGLIAIQRHVAAQAGVEPGPITVISHSLGIDPQSPRYGLAQAIERGWKSDDDFDRASGKYSLREDPNGYFVVSADHERGLVVAEHRFGGVLVKRYEADRATKIEREVAADMAVSLVSHALWLGRELTANERALRSAGEGHAGDGPGGR